MLRVLEAHLHQGFAGPATILQQYPLHSDPLLALRPLQHTHAVEITTFSELLELCTTGHWWLKESPPLIHQTKILN